MRHKVYIFDFDGTLVHSNAIKREAFYQLSDEIIQHPTVVDKVLSVIPERSRFEIVKEIYVMLQERTKKKYEAEEIDEAIHKYSGIVREGVLACPELIGASQLLSTIKRSGSLTYISSNTPEGPLNELVSARGWLQYLNGCFGFPKLKTETVKGILKTNQVKPTEVIVIGDGSSDEISAMENGCHFYKISHDQSLVEFQDMINRAPLYVQ